MKYRLLICHLLCFLVYLSTNAQSNIEIFKSGYSSVNNYVRQNNSALLGDKAGVELNYSEITGSPFWKTKWNMALLQCDQNRSFLLTDVKLNCYNGEIHYKNVTGEEMVVMDNVGRIIFYEDLDTTKVQAVFEKLNFSQASDKNNFYEVLNEGENRLLRLFSTSLDSKLDGLAGKTVNKFQTRSNYYLQSGDSLKPLSKLDKENVLGNLEIHSDTNDWLKANKNSLKTEAQVVSFLNHYNEGIK